MSNINIKIKVGCILTLLFVVIWVGVHLEANWITSIDEWGEQVLFESSSNIVNRSFLAITSVIGNSIATGILLVVAVIGIWLKDKRLSIWFFAAMTFSGGIVPQTLKRIIERPRPNPYIRGGYSFPSGHATGAIVFYGLLIALAFIYLKKSWQRNLFVLAATFVIILISWSRIRLGVHYTSDIIAGFFLGIGQVLIWASFLEKRKKLREEASEL